MKNLKITKTAIAFATTSTLLLVPSFAYSQTFADSQTYDLDITYLTQDCKTDPYACYGKGKVYILDSKEDNNIKGNGKTDDIIVIDDRECDDPNFIILNSKRIKDRNNMREIITILQHYEEENPSRWKRTTDSMQNEWVVHNVFFDRGIKKTHTNDVDLNNHDENRYKGRILKKILKN